jgi:anti-anti-sigma regulatory factor
MLRISHEKTTNTGVVLQLEGQVRGQWVEELRRACDEALGDDPRSGIRLVLDLADVSFIDPEGLALFRALNTRRVVLTNCSPFAEEQLKEVADVRP